MYGEGAIVPSSNTPLPSTTSFNRSRNVFCNVWYKLKKKKPLTSVSGVLSLVVRCFDFYRIQMEHASIVDQTFPDTGRIGKTPCPTDVGLGTGSPCQVPVKLCRFKSHDRSAAAAAVGTRDERTEIIIVPELSRSPNVRSRWYRLTQCWRREYNF